MIKNIDAVRGNVSGFKTVCIPFLFLQQQTKFHISKTNS